MKYRGAAASGRQGQAIMDVRLLNKGVFKYVSSDAEDAHYACNAWMRHEGGQ